MQGFSRRTFLKTSTAATLGLAAGAPTLLAAEEPLKVGVIHMGAISDTGWE